MPFKIIRNDITKVSADIIVNSANPRPICGGSTEAIIYEAAGYDELLAARKKIGNLNVGELGITPAFNLQAKIIFHISCPKWITETSVEGVKLLEKAIKDLENCYNTILKKAILLNAKSIAIPLLSSGIYGFPKNTALKIAQESCQKFEEYDLEINLVVYDQIAFEESLKLFRNVENHLKLEEDFCLNICSENISESESCIEDSCLKTCYSSIFQKNSQDEIANILMKMDDDSFQDKLNLYIERIKMLPAEIYRASNLNRKLFSKLKKEGYRPSKNTVLALAIGLKLNLEETEDLLSRSGFGFSPVSKTDAIFQYCISKKDFYKKSTIAPIYKLNDILVTYGEEALGES